MRKRVNRAAVQGSAPLKIDADTYYPEALAAELFGVSVDTMRRKRSGSGPLPFTRFSKRVFYRGADLIDALNAGRIALPYQPEASL